MWQQRQAVVIAYETDRLRHAPSARIRLAMSSS